MDWLKELICGSGIAHDIFILSVVIAFGVIVGKIKIFNISPGIAGVLFCGLIFGHFGLGINPDVLKFALEFGLVLFVYTIGIQVGPAFFASFRKQGIKLNALAGTIVLFGAIITSLIFWITGLPAAVVVGIMSGAVTNTPGLGAAQEALSGTPNVTPDTLALPGMGYAMAYPFGILGIIFSMLLLKWIFRVDLKREQKRFSDDQAQAVNAPKEFTLAITNDRMNGKTIDDLSRMVEGGFVISRLMRKDKVMIPQGATPLFAGDVMEVICAKDKLEDLAVLTGDISSLDFHSVPHNFISRTLVVTEREAFKKLGELRLDSDCGVSVTRIERAGLELLASPSIRLQFGDNVTITGDDEAVAKAAKILGDSSEHLEKPNIIPLFLGIMAGILIGAIPLPIPGVPVPVKLGIAGGPLLAAIILSRIRQVGPLSWYLPKGANLILREVGITLFLACVGLKSGVGFFSTLQSGQGLYWMLMGVFITLIPPVIVGCIARIFFKLDYLSLCGLVTGSCTDPPALSFAGQMTGSDAPAVTYATVYSLTMFLRIIIAQLLVIIFSL
jgi:putative transport protein